MTAQEIYEKIKAKFGDAVSELNSENIDPFVVVTQADRIADVAGFLRDDPDLDFRSLMSSSSAKPPHYPPNSCFSLTRTRVSRYSSGSLIRAWA